MRVLFIYPNIYRNVMPLSMALFSAILKRDGHDVSLFEATLHPADGTVDFDSAEGEPPGRRRSWYGRPDAPVLRALRQRIKTFGPDLLAVSVVEDVVALAQFLCSGVRDLDVLTCWGGVFPTFAPEKAIACDGVDVICVGEGEGAIAELCRRMERGQPIVDIPNLWVRDGHGRLIRNPLAPLVNPDTLPQPDFGIFNRKRFSGAFVFPVETHRGCPYPCAFCGAPPLNELYRRNLGTPFFRKKSALAIRKSLTHLVTDHKPRAVFFFADTMLAWSDRDFEEFASVYEEFKLPFTCYARPETLTEKKLGRLVDLGLEMIGIGIQHGNEAFRRRVVRRGMTNRALIDVFDMAADHSVWVHADSMVGFPGETPESACDTVELNRRIRADSRACSIFVPYHGAALRQVAVDRGYLDEAKIGSWTANKTHLNMPEFPPHLVESFAANFHHWVEADSGDWQKIVTAFR